MEDGKPDPVSVGKLKAFGSSTASSGAVGLYHVENLTPEAIEQGRMVLPGTTDTATVSRQPFDTSGSYQENMFAGRADSAPRTDWVDHWARFNRARQGSARG